MADINFDEVLSKITSNPDIMEKISQIASKGDKDNIADKLPDVIAAISPAINDSENKKSDEKTDTPANKTEKSDANINPHFPLPINKLSEKISKNSKLLLALRPYLSKERSDIIDNIVKMAQVADLMKNVK